MLLNYILLDNRYVAELSEELCYITKAPVSRYTRRNETSQGMIEIITQEYYLPFQERDSILAEQLVNAKPVSAKPRKKNSANSKTPKKLTKNQIAKILLETPDDQLARVSKELGLKGNYDGTE